MSAPIDDSILQGALESRRRLFLDNLPATVSETEREKQWVAYLLSLSSSPTSGLNVNKSRSARSGSTADHNPPLPAAKPETKKRRLNPEASGHASKISGTMQRSTTIPPSNSSNRDERPSPFVKAGARVPTPAHGLLSTESKATQAQECPHNAAPLNIPQNQVTPAKQSRHIAVQEYAPVDLFGAHPQSTSAKSSSSMHQIYQVHSTAPQSSPLQSSSPYSSFSGMSCGVSTSPTSVSMSRVDSTAGSSFQRGFDMLRVDSTKSPTSQHDFSIQKLDFSPSLEKATQSIDPMHDIVQTGAQFVNQVAYAPAQTMQRQTSSNSRQLHPKQTVAPAMSRTPSSATGYEVIRVPSSDGSFKEAIKISPASSYVRPTNEKVMCTYPGCDARPSGFKGEHEVRRHYDRTHRPARHVFVCAPLAEDPDFLSKTKCKQCQSGKEYNEDYNAGEHLRRMHFNPKQPKSHRGPLKPEDKRGGKGGGTEPPMKVLRKYMIKYSVNANGIRISEPERVEPSSSVILPNKSDSRPPPVTGRVRTPVTDSTSSVVPKAKFTRACSNSEASLASTTRFVGNTSPNVDNFSLDMTHEEPDVLDAWNIADMNAVMKGSPSNQSSFDPSSPSIDLNDPIFFGSNLTDISASLNDELSDFFSSFTSSPP